MRQGWLIDAYGARRHYVNNKLHNDDGPVVIFHSGTKYWFKENLRHREDGPAIEYSNGDKVWYYEGNWVGDCRAESCQGFTNKDFEKWKKFKAFA